MRNPTPNQNNQPNTRNKILRQTRKASEDQVLILNRILAALTILIALAAIQLILTIVGWFI